MQSLFPRGQHYANIECGKSNKKLKAVYLSVCFVILKQILSFKIYFQVLLTFVEEDIHDYTRQSSAFPLLKVFVK